MSEYKTQIQADDYDVEWSQRKLRMSSDERLAEAREATAAYADFPGADLLAVYEQAAGVLPAREATLRSAIDEEHPLAAVAQARLLVQPGDRRGAARPHREKARQVTTDSYFVAKAREVFSRAGGDPAKAGALAEWAEEAKQIGDPKRGVIVAEDGTIIAATRYQPHAVGYQAGATYVERADAARLGLFGDEVGLAVAQLPRLVGQRVIHVTMAEVTRGAGAHVPDLADPLDAARRAAREVAAAEDALRQAVIAAHAAGASPRQIGDAIGVSHTTVHRWIKA